MNKAGRENIKISRTIFTSGSVKKEQVISFCKECLCSFNVDQSTSEHKRVLYAVRLHSTDRARCKQFNAPVVLKLSTPKHTNLSIELPPRLNKEPLALWLKILPFRNSIKAKHTTS